VHRHSWTTDNEISSYFRHPSYAGFFYWSLGTQLVLQNLLSFVVFSFILWRFFYFRIRGESINDQSSALLTLITVEEDALIRFFGDEYKTYRQRVPTRIPLIA
jgi:protein-S-isoprenylcysteine O-methyltransferase